MSVTKKGMRFDAEEAQQLSYEAMIIKIESLVQVAIDAGDNTLVIKRSELGVWSDAMIEILEDAGFTIGEVDDDEDGFSVSF